MVDYAFPDVPAPGSVREVAPGVRWLRMPLPLALDHINLYLLEEQDGWWIVDTGVAVGPTEELWEHIFAKHLEGKPNWRNQNGCRYCCWGEAHGNSRDCEN